MADMTTMPQFPEQNGETPKQADEESASYFVSRSITEDYYQDLDYDSGDTTNPAVPGSVWSVLARFAFAEDGVPFQPPDAKSYKDIEKIDLYVLATAIGKGTLSLSDRPENKNETAAREFIQDITKLN